MKVAALAKKSNSRLVTAAFSQWYEQQFDKKNTNGASSKRIVLLSYVPHKLLPNARKALVNGTAGLGIQMVDGFDADGDDGVDTSVAEATKVSASFSGSAQHRHSFTAAAIDSLRRNGHRSK